MHRLLPYWLSLAALQAAAAGLSPAGQLQIAVALDKLAALDRHLDVLRRRLLEAARQLAGAKELRARLYGVGPVTALAPAPPPPAMPPRRAVICASSPGTHELP
jgi:hypothetical protein